MMGTAPIVVFAVVAFAAAAILAVRGQLKSVWPRVDLLYYPLGALGVIMFFGRDALERELMARDEAIAASRNRLAAVLSTMPSVELPDEQFATTNFGLITGVSSLAASCERFPRMDPVCDAAADFSPAINKFGPSVGAKTGSGLARLLAVCIAADSMLSALRTKINVAGNELASTYARARLGGYGRYEYDRYLQESDSMRIRILVAMNRLDSVIRDTSTSGRYVSEKYREYARQAQTVFVGLFPCITTDRKALGEYREWSERKQLLDSALAQAEVDRERARRSEPEIRRVRWLRLNLWPYVLLFALALKFGKAVAPFQKPKPASASSVTTLPDRPAPPHTHAESGRRSPDVARTPNST